MSALREFMFERVYLGPAVLAEHEKIAGVIRRLFEHYVEHPQLLPAARRGDSEGEGDLAASTGRDTQREELARRVTDYLAGMTDRYCIRAFSELEVPQAFAR